MIEVTAPMLGGILFAQFEMIWSDLTQFSGQRGDFDRQFSYTVKLSTYASAYATKIID